MIENQIKKQMRFTLIKDEMVLVSKLKIPTVKKDIEETCLYVNKPF